MTATAPSITRELGFSSVARTHAGRRRALNEDRVLERPEAGLWAVADGMGGHSDGDVAASRLVAALEQVDARASGYAKLTEIERRVQGLNAELFERRGRHGPSGSTLVALLTHEGHYACLWVGDSRAYQLRDGRLRPLTRDHSVVQDLIDAGALGEGGRRGHPDAHVLTRAVGAGESVQLDHGFADVAAGDVFVLCSDGLTACLSDEEIAEAASGADLSDAADRLLETALERGAADNVSLILVRAASTLGK